MKIGLIGHGVVGKAAAKTLKLVGDSSALPYLVKAVINDPDPVVQGSSVAAMAMFGEKISIFFVCHNLLHWIATENMVKKVGSIQNLGSVGQGEAKVWIFEYLSIF